MMDDGEGGSFGRALATGLGSRALRDHVDVPKCAKEAASTRLSNRFCPAGESVAVLLLSNRSCPAGESVAVLLL